MVQEYKLENYVYFYPKKSRLGNFYSFSYVDELALFGGFIGAMALIYYFGW